MAVVCLEFMYRSTAIENLNYIPWNIRYSGIGRMDILLPLERLIFVSIRISILINTSMSVEFRTALNCDYI